MTVLLIGGDGYISLPTTLRIATRTDERVIRSDNFARRGWLEKVKDGTGYTEIWESLSELRTRDD